MIIKKDLKSGKYVLGGIVSINAPSVVEVMALGGLDFVLLDTEHGDANFESVINMVRAAEAHKISAIVRVADYDRKLIGRYLDNGVHGIQVPMVETSDMARSVVEACKFAPDGIRGLSGGRGSKWGHVKDYPQTANRETLTVCMCETKLGVDNIEEIVKTPNLDVIFVGTGDLSLSLGYPGQMFHPEVQEAVEHVRRVCAEAGVIPGIVTINPQDTISRLNQGFRYVTVMNDMRFLCSSVQRISEEIRSDVHQADSK